MLYSLIKEHCIPTAHIHITWMWIWAVGVQCSLINVTYALTFCSNSYDCQKTNNLAPSLFCPSEKQVLRNCSFQNPSINSQKTETSRKTNKDVKSNALAPPKPHISWPVNRQWGYSRKRVENMEFPVVYIEKKAYGNCGAQLKKKLNFQGCSKKSHVEIPWVLVFDLGISKGCHTILQNFQDFQFPI